LLLQSKNNTQNPSIQIKSGKRAENSKQNNAPYLTATLIFAIKPTNRNKNEFRRDYRVTPGHRL